MAFPLSPAWAQAKTNPPIKTSLRLDEVSVYEFVKLAYGEILKRPFVLTDAAIRSDKRVTVSLDDLPAAALSTSITKLLDGHGFLVSDHAGVQWVDVKPFVREDDADEIVIYRPRFRSARYLLDIVQPLTGAKALTSAATQRHAEPVELPKKDQPVPAATPAMTDKAEVDQIALRVAFKQVDRLRQLFVDLDTPTGEVLLKAAVFEVGTTQQDGTALQLALSLSGLQAGIGASLSGDASLRLTMGGLDGVLSALDRDSRFKSISRPQVRVKNGAKARFSVGQDVPILGAQQLDRNGNPIQSVDYKPSGIILTALPEIRRDVIELDLHQELSNFVATNTGVNNSPTLIKRSVDTRLTLQPGEVVVLAGLQDDKQDQQDRRVPFFGWPLSAQSQQQKTEVLVFIEAVKIDQSPTGLMPQ